MQKKGKSGEEYLTKFPKFRKWINECVCCHAKGYSPDMLSKIMLDSDSFGYKFIAKKFSPLLLNKKGECSVCARIQLKKIDYKNFIELINNRKVKKVIFFVRNYSHYRNCMIEIKTDDILEWIEVRLTKDSSEIWKFWQVWDEKAKMFQFGKNRRHTLKDIWERIEITEIIES